jgi:hypothetical protein
MYIRWSEYLIKYLIAGSLTVKIYMWLNYGTDSDSVNNNLTTLRCKLSMPHMLIIIFTTPWPACSSYQIHAV